MEIVAEYISESNRLLQSASWKIISEIMILFVLKLNEIRGMTIWCAINISWTITLLLLEME